MISFRRMTYRYGRFRRGSRLRYYAVLTVEFTVATALVYLFLAPLICR